MTLSDDILMDSQQFTRKDVWQRILQDIRPHDEDIRQMDEYAIQGELFKPVFPQKGGWRILLTSRNESVGLHADPTCFSFKSTTLTPEESWILCLKIVFPRRERELNLGLMKN
ncbi:Disease resistance protein RPH8A [Cardamine amara subsp. amara]|uniref:Disease resistance protein RPH8A n=1 Tax=Cardamine amara subsp. amara TaxID=228776 RepID=A0ABD1BZW5_CARAN